MRILIYATVFAPSVGGLELMAKMLAEDLSRLGHLVTLVTNTPGVPEAQLEYEVVRRPGPVRLLRIFSNVDVVLHMNISLKGLWPFFFVPRPWVVGHFGQYRRNDGRVGLRDRLKYLASRLAINIACSEAIKADLPSGAMVVGNTYQDNLFMQLAGDRVRDLVFVGRLVSEKGVDLLLQSLNALRAEGLKPTLSIVGSGPEEKNLQELCRSMRLQDQVEFLGKQTGNALVEVINKHRTMVVPSRNEGFGIVALEGIACGCLVIGSDAGGLPEAIGDCGIVFRNGDVADLSRNLVLAVTDSDLRDRCLAGKERHLARFSRQAIATRYIEVFGNAIASAGAR